MRLESSATLRALMDQRGYSLGVLAHEAGCSKAFISHLLSGRRDSCSVTLAARIAASLGVSMSTLFSQPTRPTARYERVS